MARIVALIVAATLAAAPAAGLAAAPPDPTQSPFQQAPSQNQVGEQPEPTPTPAPREVDDGSIGGREALLIGVGVVALIGGIWVVISRDAKRATAGLVRSGDGALGEGRGGSATRAARRTRRLSAAERRRRRRGRAAK
ncbi:MAG TPA: hypothetical protein VF250_15285 [Conexibacter sp.]